MKKVRFLHKSHGLTPSQKCCFWQFIEPQFSGLKIILIYPKDQKMVCTNLFYPKKNK